MPRYYFDYLDNGVVTADEDGLELEGVAEAKKQAARALASYVSEVIPEADSRELMIEVRDSEGAVLRTTMEYGVRILRVPDE